MVVFANEAYRAVERGMVMFLRADLHPLDAPERPGHTHPL
jgi:hypothetical protein